jgi:hypothetical protein
MFNPLTEAEIVAAIGRTSLQAAAAEGELSDFERVQLKSAYSATRHLSVELEWFGSELDRFCSRVRGALREAAIEVDQPSREQLERLAWRLDHSPTTAEIGAAAGELLERCRSETASPWPALRTEARAALRDLCNSEVGLLSAAIEAAKQ